MITLEPCLAYFGSVAGCAILLKDEILSAILSEQIGCELTNFTCQNLVDIDLRIQDSFQHLDPSYTLCSHTTPDHHDNGMFQGG